MATPAGTGKPHRPLFYADPVALHSDRHADWRLRGGTAAFATEATAIPLVLTDFVPAARSYPILFTADTTAPIALTGLERSNLFVDAAGTWAAGCYVPAYIRRYPFVLVETPDRNDLGLAIDAAGAFVACGGGEGESLFEGGEPSSATRRALEFCRAFHESFLATQHFGQALSDAGLLIDRQVDATLPSGRKLGVTGFRIIDVETLAKLPDETVVTWHRNGWLAMIHCHLASLYHFTDLLARQGAAESLSDVDLAEDAPLSAETAA